MAKSICDGCKNDEVCPRLHTSGEEDYLPACARKLARRVAELEGYFVEWSRGSINDRRALTGVLGRVGANIEAKRHLARRAKGKK
jgi:hypothetical protein